MRRRFNSAQRVALWLAADGHCQMCGCELQPGWHADHVHPYSKGGSTDVINGAALCPSCNTKKGDSSMSISQLRAWQKDALEKFLSTDRDFLVEATPGAGKTRMALAAAREMFSSGHIRRIIVVVPSVNLQSQWSRAAAESGLDVTGTMKNADGSIAAAKHGAVVTYPQVASQPDLWRHITAQAATLVVLDEIHHAGDEENSTWGAALRTAFAVAPRRLMLSGTPFRTDGAPIPFVRYDDQGYAISDEGLTYGEAVRDGVVRPVRYEILDGRADWIDFGTQVSVNLSEAKQKDIPDALKVLYDPRQEWIPSVFRRANDELTRAREEMPDAGGLVLAPSQWHAEQYGRIMTAISGEQTTVIHSTVEDAGAQLRAFSAGSDRWIVAVKMVSEGVDIPRLAVGVYASRDMTEMWFRQVTGRFVRVRGDEDYMTATIFIPHVKVLMDLAERIEQEAQVALREAEQEASDRADREERTLELSFIEPLAASESVLTGAIVAGEAISDAELERAKEYIERIGGSMRAVHPVDAVKLLRLANPTAPTAQTVVRIPPSDVTGDQLRQSLRRQLSALVGRYAYATEQPHSHIHAQLNRMYGGKVATATVDELRKRITSVEEWIEAY